MDSLIEARLKVAEKHPEKLEMFKLEALLMEAGYPYVFNFWEDIRPVFGGEEEDPERINWDTYPFWMEIRNGGYEAGVKMMEVCFSKDEPELLVVDEIIPGGRGATYLSLTAETAIEVIKKYFEGA